MKTLRILLLCVIPCASVTTGDETVMPMPIIEQDTIVSSWLAKPVEATRLLSDMEDLSTWSHHGVGAMELSNEQARNGQYSLKMTASTFTKTPSKNGRPPGACVALYEVGGEDWCDFNRLSFWVYPDLPGFHAVSMSVVLKNEGTFKVPDEYGRRGRNFFILKNQQWNHVVWEIAHLSRDKVTGVELVYRMQGNEPGATNKVCYFADTMELQKVAPDHFEGWNVAPGKIAYSHTGYSAVGPKIAITSEEMPSEFTVHDANGKTVAGKFPVRKASSQLGEFQVLDFSELNRPGSYFVRAGDLTTEAFQIGGDIWKDTIWKTINCFYCLRCGTEIPGIHGPCHEDWLAKHDGRTIHYNGGWHDAGDLSQGLRNTCEAAYAMFLLAEQLQQSDPRTADRLQQEAQWGLDWILKTRFGDGYRGIWGTMDFWTDNVVGTVDDMAVDRVANDAYHNFHAVTAEAIAHRVLITVDRAKAEQSLSIAREDWQFAIDKLPRRELRAYAIGAIASIELYRSTKERHFLDQAIELAEVILACQQQTEPDWDVPLRGFFYRTPAKRRIHHDSHISEMQSPIAALVMLCEIAPSHPKQPEWRRCVELYATYLRKTAEFTAPYNTIPASIYSLDESSDPKFREQVSNGIRLSDRHFLRCFPVWYDLRGNFGVLLSQTRAISSAARLLNDKHLRDLAERQLQWVVGLNPFCQSTMYGEGHDFAPQYTATSGDIVGGLPVGIQSSRNMDAPFWPADNCYNFKEIWVHPSSRWLAILADLYAMASPKSSQ